jgi:hypothetical protein
LNTQKSKTHVPDLPKTKTGFGVHTLKNKNKWWKKNPDRQNSASRVWGRAPEGDCSRLSYNFFRIVKEENSLRAFFSNKSRIFAVFERSFGARARLLGLGRVKRDGLFFIFFRVLLWALIAVLWGFPTSVNQRFSTL